MDSSAEETTALPDPDTDELPVTIEEARILAATPAFQKELSSRSFIYFLKFVNILERPQPLQGKAGGITPFEQWPHLMELAKVFETQRL